MYLFALFVAKIQEVLCSGFCNSRERKPNFSKRKERKKGYKKTTKSTGRVITIPTEFKIYCTRNKAFEAASSHVSLTNLVVFHCDGCKQK